MQNTRIYNELIKRFFQPNTLVCIFMSYFAGGSSSINRKTNFSLLPEAVPYVE